MSSHSQTPPEVFVSYSHADSEYKDHLVKQLAILEEQNIISQWHDGLLLAGERWNDEIIRRLKSSRVILLLISVDFLTSVYVNEVEIKEAGRRYQAGEITVIPVLVRNVHGWKKKPFGNIKLGDLQALPSNAKFIKSGGDLDDAFADVAEGIQKAIEKLQPGNKSSALPPPLVTASHQTDYVKRHDEKGHDILERLKEWLSPGKKWLVALWGKGGTGKTRIAAETARALATEFGQRIVWASAEKRTDFTFSTLLDEIARQMGQLDALKLAQEPKEEAVRALLAQAPVLIVLDNFETVVSTEERARCIDFLAERAGCPSLITSRLKVAAPARNIPIKGMSNKEAHEFLEQLIDQTQDTGVFNKQVRSRIIKTAESNPYIMLWMIAQIDEAQTPRKVFDELAQGIGPVGERVFDRSFNLKQLGKDGRAALLALTLFVPDASRDALAEVAGFGSDLSRMDEAAKNLRMLWLIGATEENQRLSVDGLTRSLATARFSKDRGAGDFSRRFVKHFLNYAEAHASNSYEDYDSLETEKDNLVSAAEIAINLNDLQRAWRIVSAIANPESGVLVVHGYWDDGIRLNEQALKTARLDEDESLVGVFSHNLAMMRGNRGEFEEARRLCSESLEISKKTEDQSGIAVSLHQLAMIAYYQEELGEAKQMYNQSLEISKKLKDQSGIAGTLHNLAVIFQKQGELEKAQRTYNESLEIQRKLGNQSGIASSLHQLGRLAEDQGNRDEARRLYTESLDIKTRLGNQDGIAITVHQLGRLEELEERKGEAAKLYREALTIWDKLKSPNAELARRSLERVTGKSP